MSNVVDFMLSLIDERVIWLYALCALAILWFVRAFVLARRDRVNTVFPVEREVAAHSEGRALSNIGVVLGAAFVLTAVRFYVLPSIDLQKLVEPTPTPELIAPTPEPTAPTETPAPPTLDLPTATPQARATFTPFASPTPRALTAVPAACPEPGINISRPGVGARVAGRVAIYGTASRSDFQFYKVEYGQGEQPTRWNVINDIHKVPVSQGILEEWDTSGLPNGTYWLRLTVVDPTGNFPPPCDVRVIVAN